MKKEFKLPLTTHMAFVELVQIPGIHRELGVTASTVYSWRKRVEQFPDDPEAWSIPTERIERLLSIAGFKVIREKLWK